MPPGGRGGRRVLIVGEAPGDAEDAEGRHFVGKTGKLLRDMITSFGFNADRDCHLTNAIICQPGNGEKPSSEQVAWCAPNLANTIKEYQPEVIIPLGDAAVRAVIGPIWSEDINGMTRWAGWRIPCQKLNTWICPTFHPSYIARNEKRGVFALWWGRHLAAAFELEGRPFTTVPDYTALCEVIMDEDRAVRFIDRVTADGGVAAFDYETNMLKPEGGAARIVSCSICWRGKKTFAYPWTPRTREATQRFLQSPCPKIASNMKFEERWTLKEFGHRVRNWFWDTMQAAHVADNRRDITSIKFQSFVRLGAPLWNKHIEPFLETNSARTANQVLVQVEMKDLLLYNAIDSLAEYEVAVHQCKELNYEWPQV
jgi:uracil-DNA glycosylase family 4